MSDIFISYAREDRPRAAAIARALEAQGWSVWWDWIILAGKRSCLSYPFLQFSDIHVRDLRAFNG